jgi:hypothetical protein
VINEASVWADVAGEVAVGVVLEADGVGTGEVGVGKMLKCDTYTEI